ncbi:hypothetical protein H6G89_01375 [Oscillatoria sp. FACHB-1407]|uniref:hypothetical protein n=1 Tax=Oscillatoria sp. FACHB-1407 TaxID=2692847 RepID=UPI001688598A|nr:hypothetical protein [Oscillatoria sp. FACHB-1407]MBD2459681.1 hypothetical protein [Oscillatoria sp. FACHB-1407]
MELKLTEKIIGKLRSVSHRNPYLSRLLYALRLVSPPTPRALGTNFFRKNSVWELTPYLCSCDLEFIEYLKLNQVSNKSIFHFGTGSHHVVGLANQEFETPNEIFGVTAAAREHERYVQQTLKNQKLAKYYKVLFADIYTLTDNCLPMFDLVTLFHLCEFYLPQEAPLLNQDDPSLVELFLRKLNPGGRLLFYTKSIYWKDAEAILQRLEADNRIKRVEEYKSLLIYAKSEAKL